MSKRVVLRRGEGAAGQGVRVGEQHGAAVQPAGVGGALPRGGVGAGAAPRRRAQRARLARPARRRGERAGESLAQLPSAAAQPADVGGGAATHCNSPPSLIYIALHRKKYPKQFLLF